MHIDNIDDQETQTLLDSLASFNLTQNVRIPIHNKGHTPDVIITTIEDEPFQPTNTIAGLYISDHRLIILETSETKPESKIQRHKIRKINEKSIYKFCKNFNNDPIMQATTLEEAVSNMNDMLRTLDLVATTKEVEAKKRRPKSWYDEELKQQRKILKTRECKWFNDRVDSHWHLYKCKRNRYINILKLKKTHNLHKLAKQNSTDTKKLFKLINKLAGNKDQIPLPEAKSDKDLAEEFAQFFFSKIE